MFEGVLELQSVVVKHFSFFGLSSLVAPSWFVALREGSGGPLTVMLGSYYSFGLPEAAVWEFSWNARSTHSS